MKKWFLYIISFGMILIICFNVYAQDFTYFYGSNKYDYSNAEEVLLKPKFDGEIVEDTYTQINVKCGSATDSKGNVFMLKNIYISEKGKTMVSLRDAGKIVNIEYMEWNDLTKTAAISIYYESGRQKDIYVDLKNQKISSNINGEYTEKEIEVENIDGFIYIPLRDFLNAFGIDDSRIYWDNNTGDVLIYNFYNFNTSKVTVGTRYENYIGDKRFYYITDKNTIRKITEICEQGFYSIDIEQGRLQGGANGFIDFNNGMVIELYLDEDLNIGYLDKYCYLPDGLVGYIKEIAKAF